MPRVFIIANESDQARKLRAELAQRGFDCLIVRHNDGAIEQIAGQSPGLMLLDTDEATTGSEAWEQAQRIRQERQIPIIVLVTGEKLNDLDSNTSIDDFVVKPWDISEIATRAKRVIKQTSNAEGRDLIKCGDLLIDTARCEVSINGRLLALTFKEYELLKFLARNKGRVFTRDALLNEVWGYDYYGGDRTVDVHIRRLRSKLSDYTNNYIQTVRNIGYKFSQEA